MTSDNLHSLQSCLRVVRLITLHVGDHHIERAVRRESRLECVIGCKVDSVNPQRCEGRFQADVVLRMIIYPKYAAASGGSCRKTYGNGGDGFRRRCTDLRLLSWCQMQCR